jgi:hypothetical protein
MLFEITERVKRKCSMHRLGERTIKSLVIIATKLLFIRDIYSHWKYRSKFEIFTDILHFPNLDKPWRIGRVETTRSCRDLFSANLKKVDSAN